jgi:hypothetical protein
MNRIFSSHNSSFGSSSDSDDDSSTELELARVKEKMKQEETQQKNQPNNNDMIAQDKDKNNNRRCPSLSTTSNEDNAINDDIPTSSGNDSNKHQHSILKNEPPKQQQKSQTTAATTTTSSSSFFNRSNTDNKKETNKNDDDDSDFSDDSDDNSELVRLIEKFNSKKEELHPRTKDPGPTEDATTDKQDSSDDDSSVSSSSSSSTTTDSDSTSSNNSTEHNDDDENRGRVLESAGPKRTTTENDTTLLLRETSNNCHILKSNPTSKPPIQNPYLKPNRKEVENNVTKQTSLDNINSREQNVQAAPSNPMTTSVLLLDSPDPIKNRPANMNGTSSSKKNEVEVPGIINVDQGVLDADDNVDDLTVSIYSGVDSKKPTVTSPPPRLQQTSQTIQNDHVELPIQDSRQQITSEDPEVDHSFFAAPPYEHRDAPRVCRYNETTRPFRFRKKIPVSSLFDPPINLMWPAHKIKEFNHFQTEMSNILRDSDDNIVVSAPTGAGKSPFCILRSCTLEFTDKLCSYLLFLQGNRPSSIWLWLDSLKPIGKFLGRRSCQRHERFCTWLHPKHCVKKDTKIGLVA